MRERERKMKLFIVASASFQISICRKEKENRTEVVNKRICRPRAMDLESKNEQRFERHTKLEVLKGFDREYITKIIPLLIVMFEHRLRRKRMNKKRKERKRKEKGGAEKENGSGGRKGKKDFLRRLEISNKDKGIILINRRGKWKS